MEDINVQNTEAPQQNGQQGQEPTVDGKQPEVKTFTQEEVDKIVEKRLSRERKRLSLAMGPQDPKEAELDERERIVAKRELRLDAAEIFQQENLPTEALELLNYTDKEACEQSIELVRKIYGLRLQEAVDRRLWGGKPPKRAPENDGQDLRKAFGL